MLPCSEHLYYTQHIVIYFYIHQRILTTPVKCRFHCTLYKSIQLNFYHFFNDMWSSLSCLEGRPLVSQLQVKTEFYLYYATRTMLSYKHKNKSDPFGWVSFYTSDEKFFHISDFVDFHSHFP